ncbi:hypothetical protein O9992_16880 [Vibrio lentus]|nr:hypothetical protein [Vibrio lentus]
MEEKRSKVFIGLGGGNFAQATPDTSSHASGDENCDQPFTSQPNSIALTLLPVKMPRFCHVWDVRKSIHKLMGRKALPSKIPSAWFTYLTDSSGTDREHLRSEPAIVAGIKPMPHWAAIQSIGIGSFKIMGIFEIHCRYDSGLRIRLQSETGKSGDLFSQSCCNVKWNTSEKRNLSK